MSADVKKIRIGIDPGKKGFVTAIINSKEYLFSPIPLIGKEVDIHELDKIIKDFMLCDDIHCVIEDLHSIFGASSKSTFSFGFICGATEAVLIANKMSFTKIKPKEWQKQMWQGIPVQKKPSSTGKTMVNDTKLMSLMAAKRLFPNIDLRATNRSKNPHDGKVDSLLLASYCEKNY